MATGMSETITLGLVRIGAMNVAFPAELLEEIVRGPVELMPFPQAPRHVLGAFVFRGTAVPAIDLAALIKPAASGDLPAPSAYVAVIRHPAGRFAVSVDEAFGVVHAQAKTITAIDAHPLQGTGLFSQLYTPPAGGRISVVLDLNAVLAVDGLRSAVVAAKVQGEEKEAARSEAATLSPQVIFRAGNACFALDAGFVGLLERREASSTVIESDAVLRGFRSFRGDQRAVVDLLALLRLPPGGKPPKETHYLVAEQGSRSVAFCIDDVVALEPVDRANLSALPEGGMARPEFFAGCWVSPRGEIVLVLEPERLMAEASVVDRATLFAPEPEPEEDDEDWDDEAVEVVEEPPGELARYLVYRAGGGTLATALLELEAVLYLPEDFVDLRGRGEALVGMCARLGRSFKVLDLGALMGRPTPDIAPGRPVLVVRTGGGMVGYLVESVDFLHGARSQALPHASGRGPGRLPAFRRMIRARSYEVDRSAGILELAQLETTLAGAA